MRRFANPAAVRIEIAAPVESASIRTPRSEISPAVGTFPTAAGEAGFAVALSFISSIYEKPRRNTAGSLFTLARITPF